MRLLLAAGLILLSADMALAEPISLTTAVVSALLSSLPVALTAPIIAGIGITATANLIATALVGGALLAISLTRSSPQRPSNNPGNLKSTFQEAEGPEIRAIGRVRLGGLKAFGATTGNDRYRLILHCKGPTDGFEEYYISGREVVLAEDGQVRSRPWPATDSTSYAYITSKIGDGTETASAALIASFPDIWTTDHKVQGISQSEVRFVNPGLTTQAYLELYQSGVPEVEVVQRVPGDIYDPRTESTAWTENGILCAVHVYLTFPDVTSDDIDWDFIADQADAADALVDTLTGTEPRARCSGVWSSEQSRGELMLDVLRSIGAEFVERPAGKIGIQLVDDDREPSLTIPGEDVLEWNWQAGPESVERPNVCRVAYYSRERNYEMAEVPIHTFDGSGAYTGPAWARITDEITRNGEKIYDARYPFCPSASQAQRLARRDFAVLRGKIIETKTNLVGLAAWDEPCIAIEQPEELGTVTVALLPPRENMDEGEVQLPAVIWPTLATWVPASDEAAAPDVIPDIGLNEGLDRPDAPTAATVITNADGTFTRLAFTVPLDAANSADTHEEVYRTYNADGEPNPWRPMTGVVNDDGSYYFAEVEEDLTGELADFRVRTFAGATNNGSRFSPTFQTTLAVDNTAPADPTISVSYDGGSDTITITARAPESVNVAYMNFTGDDAPAGNHAVQPDEIVTWTVNPTTPETLYEFSAQAFSTNGTGSNVVEDDVTTPA